MRRTEKGEFYSIDVCTKCEKRLTDNQLLYSNATCPHCGNTDRGTVIDYKKITLRKVITYELYKIIGGLRIKKNKLVTFEGATHDDHLWVKRNNPDGCYEKEENNDKD